MTVRKGYTLIEVLIVVALLSILLSICVPNLKVYKRIMVKQEISELKRDLLYARNNSIAKNKSHIVYFCNDTNSYSLTTGEDNKVIKSKTFISDLRLNKDDKHTSFIFTPSGTVASSNTVYIYTEGNKRYSISLTPVTGRIGIYFE